MAPRKRSDPARQYQAADVDQPRTAGESVGEPELPLHYVLQLQRELGNARVARMLERDRRPDGQRPGAAGTASPLNRLRSGQVAPAYLRSVFTSGQADIARYHEDLRDFRRLYSDQMLDRYRSGLAEVGSRTMQRQASPLHEIRRMGRADKQELPHPSQLPTNDEMVMEVLTFFYPTLTPPTELNNDLRDLAARMLWEAIKASEAMDLVPRPPAVPGIGWMALEAVKAAWRQGRAQGIYEAVRAVVANRFRTAYDMGRTGI